MGAFNVTRTTKFDRLISALAKQHAPVVDVFRKTLIILESDPYNSTRQYKVKKLIDVTSACWRLSIGAYRVRYDIVGSNVILKSIRHRRDSYRGKDL